MKVLIVDDNPDYTLMLTRLLRLRMQVDTTEVLSGALALEALKSGNFDLIICDYNMPNMDGYEVFQAMQKAGLSCPFLVYTNEDLNELPKFKGPGFLGVVKKLELEKLFGYIETVAGSTK